jgi:hypothetical protein
MTTKNKNIKKIGILGFVKTKECPIILQKNGIIRSKSVIKNKSASYKRS